MKKYIQIKETEAEPRLKLEVYYDEIKDGLDDGYRIILADGMSHWMPKDIFEKSYQLVSDSNGFTIKNGIIDPYLRRIIGEALELEDKIKRYDMFVNVDASFEHLPENEKASLTKQLLVMKCYLEILYERINNFE